MANKEIKIKGCNDCIFCRENDMSVGYGCKLDESDRKIKQSKTYTIITPKWCPLKISNVIIKLV